MSAVLHLVYVVPTDHKFTCEIDKVHVPMAIAYNCFWSVYLESTANIPIHGLPTVLYVLKCSTLALLPVRGSSHLVWPPKPIVAAFRERMGEVGEEACVQ